MSTHTDTEATQWVSKIHVILPDEEQRRVILIPGDSGWVLPHLEVEGGIWIGDSKRLIPLLREKLPLTTAFSVLRHLGITKHAEERWDLAYPVLELHERAAEPLLGGRWVDEAELATLHLATEDQRALLLAFLREAASSDVPRLRTPWARPGWFQQAAGWMAETIKEMGRIPTGPAEQYKSLGISSLLRQPTDGGMVYLKATAHLPLFVNEGHLMAHLSSHFPQHIPAPLALHKDTGWMLLDDFGLNVWESDKENADFAPVMAQYAALQRASAPLVDELLEIGCLNRRLPVLVEQIPLLVQHSLTAIHARPEDLSALARLAPALQERCIRLASFQIPHTLVHGDLHMGNTAHNGDGFYFFDWSDACVAHPFLDMITPYFFEDNPEKQVAMRDNYLAGWAGVETPDRLHLAWELAKPLAALHQAVSYLHILLGQEEIVHMELASGLGDFVKYTVRTLGEI